MYTSSGPYYTFEEKRKGSIEPGKLADLAILSDDFMTVPEERIKDIKALTTIVGGKIVYQRRKCTGTGTKTREERLQKPVSVNDSSEIWSFCTRRTRRAGRK